MEEQKFEVSAGFFDAVNNDRTYRSSQMNEPYVRLISNGVFATPQGTPSTDLQVLSSEAMDIIVKSGKGMFDYKWFNNSSDISITVPSNNNVVPRIDSVIVQIDNSLQGRVGNIIYRIGTPGAEPSAPDINTDDELIEYRIANIYVNPDVTEITQSMITDLRGSEECGWVTSLIQQVDTTELFRQYQAAYSEMEEELQNDFNDWFDEIKGQLDEDAAAHIQNEINDINDDINALQTYIPKVKTITLLTSGWVQNQTTELYEYTITDTDVTENYLINGYMDLANQGKMADGYILSGDGSYKIITSTLPSEAITMQITKQILQVSAGE